MTITQTSPLPRFGRFADLLAPIGLLGGIIRRRESSPGDRGTQWTLAPQEMPPSEEGSRSPVAARALAAGQVAPPVRSAPATAHLPDGLTERQAEVLGLLAAGLTNREIAARLVLSTRTVDHHIAAIYTKIHARRRTDAVRYALRHNLAIVIAPEA